MATGTKGHLALTLLLQLPVKWTLNLSHPHHPQGTQEALAVKELQRSLTEMASRFPKFGPDRHLPGASTSCYEDARGHQRTALN